MQPHSTTEMSPRHDDLHPRTGDPVRRADRLTVAAAVAMLLISALHTAVFAAHGWWDLWLAGPFRIQPMPIDSTLQFWALPGGFAIPTGLLALVVFETGRRGVTVPAYVGVTLAGWAIACVWIVGPSGFLLFAVPATLLMIASGRVRPRRQV